MITALPLLKLVATKFVLLALVMIALPELRFVNVAVVAAVAVMPLRLPPVITALAVLKFAATRVVILPAVAFSAGAFTVVNCAVVANTLARP